MNSSKRVLLVDDFEDSRAGLKKLLEIEGYEVLEAVDGAQAIEFALSSKPDIILMDLSLPGVDGLSATKKIKEDASMNSVPIIALSAHDGEYIERMLETAGWVDFVTKPVDFDALLVRMAKHLPA